MEKYTDILLDKAKMVREWKTYIHDKAVKAILPITKIYIFGSLVKGEVVAGSDVDVLIFSKTFLKQTLIEQK